MIDDTSNVVQDEEGNYNHDDKRKCWKEQKYTYADAENALNTFIKKRYISQKLLPPYLLFNLDMTQDDVKDVCNKYKIKYKGKGMSPLTFHNHFYKCIDYIVLNQYKKSHTKTFKNKLECIEFFMY